MTRIDAGANRRAAQCIQKPGSYEGNKIGRSLEERISAQREEMGLAPVADAAGVDVNEAGSRIISDTAEMEREGDPLEEGKLAASHVDIRSPALDVHAVARHTLALRCQPGVRRRRAVSGDQVERLAGVQFGVDVVQQVEQIGIDRLDFVGAEVAEEIIDFGQGARNVVAILEIDRPQGFTGMRIVHRKRAWLVGAAMGEKASARDPRFGRIFRQPNPFVRESESGNHDSRGGGYTGPDQATARYNATRLWFALHPRISPKIQPTDCYPSIAHKRSQPK